MSSTPLGAADAASASAAFEKVFVNAYPYDAPFRSSVQDRLILAPVLNQFNPDQFASVASAAQATGNGSFYFGVCGTYPDGLSDHWPHRQLTDLWLIAGSDYEAYSQTPEFGTTALWSPNANWGILISHEWFAVVGGISAFVAHLKDTYPSVERGRQADLPPSDQVRLLIKDVATWEDKSWLPHLLVHVYGSTAAKRLLGEDFPNTQRPDETNR